MKCIVCGNDIKENLNECPICGSQQMGAPVYNTQQYSNLQHQINNMHINNNQQPVSQPQPVVQPQPISSYQQPIYSSQYMYSNQYTKPTTGRDVISLLANLCGFFWSACTLLIIASGIDEFRAKLIEELSKNDQYKDMANNPKSMTLYITCLIFIPGIIAFLTSFSSRTVKKTTLNTFNFLASILVLAVAVFSTWYLYNNL